MSKVQFKNCHHEQLEVIVQKRFFRVFIDDNDDKPQKHVIVKVLIRCVQCESITEASSIIQEDIPEQELYKDEFDELLADESAGGD